MNKIIGYIIALAGLALTMLSLNLTKLNISLPASIKPMYVTVAGVIVIVVGILLTLEKKGYKTKQASEEVPIYEGEGKKRVIVGYKRGK